MKSLVIAEKPSVGRDIAKVLYCNKKTNAYIEGEKYIVTWAMGHLVTLSDPEGYKDIYKEWKMEDLPIIPNKFKTEIIKQTRKQYEAIKSLIHRKDVGTIVIATDAGREGELVARLILEKANNKKPIKRLWISSVTDKAIKDGFNQLKDGRVYNHLYEAALCRAEADWLVGINATRALTCKYNAQLSCGRVQTPTLAMILQREEEIKKFIPKSYYGLEIEANNIVFQWKDKKSGSNQTFQKEKILEKEKLLKGKNIQIQEMIESKKSVQAPLLYDLTELQRDANRYFGYSAKETLNIMQRLYENYKVLTYPRTDCRYITTDIVPTIKDRLKACSIGPYRKMAGSLVNKTIQAKANFVNDKKVTDHHAIIPTEQYVPLERMSNEERKIYDLVVKRFLAVLYPPFEYNQIIVNGVIEGEVFVAKGKTIKHLGWKEVYGVEKEEVSFEENEEEVFFKEKDQILSEIKKGDAYAISKIQIREGKTKPPTYFNEATLLSAMEHPIKYLQDKKLAKTLAETGGLGTVATRADIIEKLFHTFLLEKKGKEIHITSKAKQLLQLVPEDLKKPELTAQWEDKLTKISNGQLKREEFMNEICAYTQHIIHEIKEVEGQFKYDNITNKKCPNCGKRLLAVKGKNANLLTCQDRGCGYREIISRLTNARCPVCHKKMELFGKGEDAVFRCSCGHKEKKTKFEERRMQEGAGVKRKDIQRYLRKQQQEAKQMTNNIFADALKDIQL